MRNRPWRANIVALAIAIAAAALMTGCESLEVGETERHAAANVTEADRQLTLGNETAARAWFDRAVKIAPKSASTYLGPNGVDGGDLTGGIIWSLTLHDDWPDMEAYLSKAVQVPQLAHQWLIWSALASAQQQMGETQAATVSYQHQIDAMGGAKTAAPLSTQSDDFQIQYADALWNSGQQAEARTDLLRLISHHPSTAAEPQNELAYLEAVANVNLPEAARLSAAAVQAARDSGYPDEILGEYLDTLGWVEYRQKQYGPALASLQEALDYIPREAVSHYHMAEIYQALNQSVPAQIEIHRAAYLAPSDFDTKVALQKIVPALPQPTLSKPSA